MSLTLVRTDDQCDLEVLSKASDSGKFAVPMGAYLPAPTQLALERAQINEWVRLIDVSPIRALDGIMRVFMLTDAGRARLDALKNPASPHEVIDRAAYRVGDVIYTTPRPGRHRQALDAAIAASACPCEGEQGFATSAGRFVSRTEAFEIAVRECQLLDPQKMTGEKGAKLYTEDLW